MYICVSLILAIRLRHAKIHRCALLCRASKTTGASCRVRSRINCFVPLVRVKVTVNIQHHWDVSCRTLHSAAVDPFSLATFGYNQYPAVVDYCTSRKRCTPFMKRGANRPYTAFHSDNAVE